MNPTQFKASYAIIKDKELIIEFYSGDVSLEALKAYRLKQTSDVDFSPTYDILTDIRSAVYGVGTIDQVQEYVEYVISKGTIMGARKSATIVSTPNQHVYLNLFSKYNEKLPQEFNFFFQEEEAIAYLDKDISVNEVVSMLENLRNNPQFVWNNDMKGF